MSKNKNKKNKWQSFIPGHDSVVTVPTKETVLSYDLNLAKLKFKGSC